MHPPYLLKLITVEVSVAVKLPHETDERPDLLTSFRQVSFTTKPLRHPFRSPGLCLWQNSFPKNEINPDKDHSNQNEADSGIL